MGRAGTGLRLLPRRRGLETYGEDILYTKVVSRRMIQMTHAINDDWYGLAHALRDCGDRRRIDQRRRWER